MRLYLLTILIFVGSTLMYAQPKIDYRGGVNFFSSSVNLAGDKFVPSLGFYLGAIYNLTVKNTKLHIRPEISYSKERLKYIAPRTTDMNIKYTFNYLNLPIIASYQLKSKLEIEGGVQYALLINSTYKQFGRLKNYAAKTSFGLGFGLRYPIVDKGVILQARYIKGLTCVCNGLEGDPEKLSGIQLGIIYNK